MLILKGFAVDEEAVVVVEVERVGVPIRGALRSRARRRSGGGLLGLDLWLGGRSRRFRPTTTCRMNSVLGGGLEVTGVKTSRYLLNKFGARGRQGSMRRLGRLWGWLCGRSRLWSVTRTGLRAGHYIGSLIGGLLGGGREEVVVVGVDGVADGFAPAVRAERVDVFLLGDMDGLQEGLGQVGDGAGGFGFYIAADNGGD